MRFFSSITLATVALAAAATAVVANDVNVLQYALVLENLEAQFYAQGLANYSAAAFIAAGYSKTAQPYITVLASHENAHVQALSAAITNNYGNENPLSTCAAPYNFSISSVQQFMETALVLENYGVGAYVGALASITTPGLQQVAAAIATIEARHATVLAQLQLPSDNAPVLNGLAQMTGMDTAYTPAAVVAIVAGYLSTCTPLQLKAVNVIVSNTASRTLPAAYTTATAPATAATATTLQQNDINALTYALAIESLELAFFTNFQALYNDSQFTDAGYPAGTWSNFNVIAAHEASHVAFLTNYLAAAAATVTPTAAAAPAAAVVAAYSFAAVTNVTTYVKTAAKFELLAVQSYVGVINAVTSPAAAAAAAAIATVEARHSSYLRSLVNAATAVTAAEAFEVAMTPTQAMAAVASVYVTGTAPVLVLPVSLMATGAATTTATTAATAVLAVAAASLMAVFMA